MRQIQTILKLSAVAAFALSVFSFNAQAANDNKKLEGDWASTITRTCITSNAGFGPNLESLGPTSRTSTLFRPALTFDGVGSGTWNAQALNINMTNLGAGAQAIIQFMQSCTFDYTVNPDDSFTMQNINCLATNIAGSGVGNTITTTVPQLSGQIDPKGNSFVMSDTGTVVETLIITTTTGGNFTLPQICHRPVTAVRKK